MKPYPYRIPYKGGKQKIAHELISLMREYKPQAKYFVDLFGGGGALSFCALQMGYSVVYNDADSDISGLVKYIQERIASGDRSQFGLWVRGGHGPSERENRVARHRNPP